MTHIYDLNDDCLLHVCCFLNIYELLQFAKVSDRLKYVAEKSLQQIQFLELTDHIVQRVSVDEVKYIFTQVGRRLKAIGLADLRSSNTLSKFVDLIPLYLVNIEELNLEWIDQIPLQTYGKIFGSCKKIKSLKIFECNITDEVCALMYLLPDLTRLDLSENRLVTGKYLKKLKNLIDLRVSCCNIQAKYFQEICDSMQLRMLDIRHCTMLFQDSFERLMHTQKNLELIQVSNYPCGEAAVIAQLPNLKHITISYPDGVHPTQLLRELVLHKKHSLESIEIYWKHFSERSVRHKVFLLENLRRLVILDARSFAEEDLKAVSLAFPFLKSFHCSGLHYLPSRSLRKFAKRAKSLEELNIVYYEYFPDVLYYRMLEDIWRKEHGKNLLACMTQIHFSTNILKVSIH